jgi:hypothetical protein
MRIRKRAGTGLVAVASAALAIGLGATPALASTTLIVKVSNGGSYTATASKTVFTDNGASVTCSSTTTTKASTATGKIPTATVSGTSPVKIGTVATLNFKNCTGPLGPVKTSVTALPYSVKVDSVTNSTGETDGMITGIDINVSMTGCTFTVTGKSPGYYVNSSHTLHMTTTGSLPIKPLNSARLTISNVSGCAGIINNADHPTFKGTYTLNKAITIKSKT